MPYQWSAHAVRDRLPERTGLTKDEIEAYLKSPRYIITRRLHEVHHLIWDHKKRRLIAIPVVQYNGDLCTIPTVLPVSYGSGYSEWQCAEAEHAWRGDEYFVDTPWDTDSRCSVEVGLARRIQPEERWHRPRDENIMYLFTWTLHSAEAARTGFEGVVALYRERGFRTEVARHIRDLGPGMRALTHGGEPRILIKKPGAIRYVPIDFFLLPQV